MKQNKHIILWQLEGKNFAPSYRFTSINDVQAPSNNPGRYRSS